MHPKTNITLTPGIYSQEHFVEEAGAMFRAAKNPKHKCILALIYSCGWRRGLMNHRSENIGCKQMPIKIKNRLVTSWIGTMHHSHPNFGGYGAQTIEK